MITNVYQNCSPSHPMRRHCHAPLRLIRTHCATCKKKPIWLRGLSAESQSKSWGVVRGWMERGKLTGSDLALRSRQLVSVPEGRDKSTTGAIVSLVDAHNTMVPSESLLGSWALPQFCLVISNTDMNRGAIPHREKIDVSQHGYWSKPWHKYAWNANLGWN